MDNSYELTGETEYLTLYTGFRINRCRYKRGRLCIKFKDLYSYKKFYIKTQRTSNFIKYWLISVFIIITMSKA